MPDPMDNLPINQRGMLVNRLTVKDAIHLVRSEGGNLSTLGFGFRILLVVAVAAFTARAIVYGQATVWHLFLPLLGEYLVLLVSLPIINRIISDKRLRQDSRQSIRLLSGFVIAAAIWIMWRSHNQENPWLHQAEHDLSQGYAWIVGHKMLWPILGASLGILMSFPGRIASFRKHGPPFVAVGIGCAMRFIIPLFFCFLLPVVASGKLPLVWIIWAILLLAELAALAMHWDLQRRLRLRGIDL
jgi:hypothetical protein